MQGTEVSTRRGSPPAFAAGSEQGGDFGRGLRVKRTNAIVALLVGGSCAASAIHFGSGEAGSATGWGAVVLSGVLGAFAGVIYANGFEYLLHRFFLHWGEGYLVRQHGMHHSTPPHEAKYVLFSSAAWVVVLVFALNAIPVFVLGHWLGSAFAAGMFSAFTLYYIAYEEIHWRIHLGGLPSWMRFARRHHMLHHRGFEGRYNVFLPIFDWIFQSRALLTRHSAEESK